MAVLQVRVDEELKNRATILFNELGIDLSTAIRMFLKKAVSIGGMPFDMKLDEPASDILLALEIMNTLSEKNGNSQMTLDEINDEIQKIRDERRVKK